MRPACLFWAPAASAWDNSAALGPLFPLGSVQIPALAGGLADLPPSTLEPISPCPILLMALARNAFKTQITIPRHLEFLVFCHLFLP